MNLDDKQSEPLGENEGNEPFDDEEELKVIPPPLYICLHQAQSSGCKLWYLHPKDPFPYRRPVNARTPCPVCGCLGYLQQVK